MIRRVTLKKAHFSGRDGYVSDKDKSVSNGHWMLRASAIANLAAMETPDALGAAMGLHANELFSTFEQVAATSRVDRHAWQSTKFLFSAGRVTARIFQSGKTGDFAGIDTRILAMMGANEAGETLYSVSKDAAFMDAETIEDSILIAMPFRIEDFPTRPVATPEPKVELTPDAALDSVCGTGTADAMKIVQAVDTIRQGA